MPRARWLLVLPFLFFFVGLGLSTWRFRLHDALGGLAFGLGGVVALIVVAAILPASAVAPRPARERDTRPRDTVPR
jgi:hypothetical protein